MCIELNKGYRLIYFFLSSRRRHTRFDCDWSSDVCSSDLAEVRYAKFWVDCFRLDPANSGKDPRVNETYKAAYLIFGKALTSLKLRINPEERSKRRRNLNAAFSDKLDELRTKWEELDSHAAADLTEELRTSAIPILRAEWKVIETGG